MVSFVVVWFIVICALMSQGHLSEYKSRDGFTRYLESGRKKELAFTMNQRLV